MDAAQTELLVGYLVKRVQQALRRRCDAALRPTGLSMAQYSVLRALADHPDASASELARLCFVTRQSLRDVLTGLRSAGLIDEAESRDGGRAQPLNVTAQGKRRLAVAHTAVAGVEAAMLEGVSETARRQLTRALSECAVNLEQA